MRTRALALMLVTAFSATAVAQRVGAPPHFHARPSGFNPGFGPGFGRGLIPVLDPFPLYDSLGWDYLPTVNSAPSAPQVVVVQSPVAPRAPEPTPTPSQPLMIELRGDTYVQVSGSPDSQSQTLHASDAASRVRSLSDSGDASSKARRSQSALLIFRDGHREEISAYTIASGILYAKADFYTDGSWNRGIPMASLNLPETIQSNLSRGVSFRVPGAPNEVVVGP